MIPRRVKVACQLRSLLLVAVLAGPSGAQGARRLIGDTPSCATCRVAVAQTTVLAVPDTVPALVSPFGFARDSRGNVYVTDPFGEVGVRQFDARGRYLRTIGRKGQGPGQFMAIGSVAIGPGDSIHVFHAGHSVFSTDGRHVRTRTALGGALGRSVRITSDGRYLAHAQIASAAAFGQPLHWAATDDSVLTSFGLGSSEPAQRGSWSLMRVLSNVSSGSVWSGRVNQYRLEQWALPPKQIQEITRETAWFEPWTDWDSRPLLSKPKPRLMSVYVSPSDGLLWTLSLVADANWRAVDARVEGSESRMATTAELVRAFDAVVEVIDPVSATLVAATRFDNMFLAFLSDGTLVDIAEVRNEVVVRLFSTTVQRR